MEHCEDHSAHERAIRVHDKRLDSHGKQIDIALETLSAIKEIERQNQERIDALEERIASLEAMPSQRWDTLVKALVTGVVGAVVGFCLAQIGL